MGASGPPSSSSGGGGEGKISSSRGAGGKGSSIGGGGGGKAPPRAPSVSSPSPRRGGGGKGRSGVGRRKRAVSKRPSTPFLKLPSFHSPNPSPKNSQGSRGVREGNGGAWGLRAGVVQLPLQFGKRTRRQDSCPTFPPPTPRRGLGPVPGALAPSHELRDEVRTSARDGVAAPSPLRGNLPKRPNPEATAPSAAPAPGQPPAPPHTFRGRRRDLAHPAHLCALGPGGRHRLAVPGPEGIHFGLRGHHRGELLLRGVKSRSRHRDRDRGGRAGGRHGQAGLWARGAGFCGAKPGGGRPRVPSPRAAPRSSPPAGACAPRPAGEAGCADSAPRSEPPVSWGGGTRAGGGERGGESAAPRPYKERPREGGGESGRRTRQETPPGRGPGLAPGPQPLSRSPRPGPRPRRSARQDHPSPCTRL